MCLTVRSWLCCAVLLRYGCALALWLCSCAVAVTVAVAVAVAVAVVSVCLCVWFGLPVGRLDASLSSNLGEDVLSNGEPN